MSVFDILLAKERILFKQKGDSSGQKAEDSSAENKGVNKPKICPSPSRTLPLYEAGAPNPNLPPFWMKPLPQGCSYLILSEDQERHIYEV